MAYRWDIFCRVIDNYGDAGVCWRLASDLAQRGEAVRLYIDQPTVLQQLADIATSEVIVATWPAEDKHFGSMDVADVVIEAFACDPPAAYIAAMAERANHGQPPAWINLEYLTAEDWVAAYHQRPSPHPRYPLTKYFYFPGFTPDSGGLLREAWVAVVADAEQVELFEAEPATQSVRPEPVEGSNGASTVEALPFDRLRANGSLANPLRIFLFCYAQPALTHWLAGLIDTGAMQPTTLAVAPGPVAQQLTDWQTAQSPNAALTIEYPSFVPQADFDALLARHDLLFVRGEDSFVRAQWAAKPLIWHIYPQADAAHLNKLDAFYARYLSPETLTDSERGDFMAFVHAWNGNGDAQHCQRHWPTLLTMLPALHANAQHWRTHLFEQVDLTTQLKAFVADLLK